MTTGAGVGRSTGWTGFALPVCTGRGEGSTIGRGLAAAVDTALGVAETEGVGRGAAREATGVGEGKGAAAVRAAVGGAGGAALAG